MKIYFWIFLLTSMIAAQTKFNDVNELVNSGEYTKAAELIENKIKSTTITSEDKLDLLFEKERLDRIKIDFNKTADDVLKFINKYYPDVKEKDLAKWENDGSLEYKIIDGKKWYFSRSAPNLFRINKEAKEQKLKIDGFKKDPKDVFLEEHIPLILDESANGNEDLVRPVTFKLDYTVTVDANDVPDGEIIRCWLPFPREGHRRQVDVKLLSVNSDEYVLASNDNQQRTVYIQKPAIKDQPTIFNMVLEVTGYNEINF
ncbi:MAG TPA: transglutaminase domain-containing protein, partial [Ignavibacteriaceae bacterium]|nr:transglutaminase domain-containing protein [Ignavibacteriaceae bacterium]